MCVNDSFQFCTVTVHTLPNSISCRKEKVKHTNNRIFFVWGFFFSGGPAKTLIRIIPIDLFSLYVLFSQYRSCDNTLENFFFQISSYSLAYLHIMKRQRVKVPPGTSIGKTKLKVKEVYSFPLHGLVLRACLHGGGETQVGEVTRLSI